MPGISSIVAERRPATAIPAIPEGYEWCPHSNGYGSSLKDRNERCVRCNGAD